MIITVAHVPDYGRSKSGESPSIKLNAVNPKKLNINCNLLEEPSKVYGNIKQANK
jgi:hypothetical protein|tara:strand:+ start:265 stop:429 length:165 start_codon:yes stop_codon:yes gene_type:complete